MNKSKRMGRRLLCLGMTMAMVLSMVPGMSAMAAGPDVPDSGYEEIVDGAYSVGPDVEVVEVPTTDVTKIPETPVGDKVAGNPAPGTPTTAPVDGVASSGAGESVGTGTAEAGSNPANVAVDMTPTMDGSAAMFAAPVGSELHVANGRGNDETGNGSVGNPYLSIGGALAAAEDAGMDHVTIVLDTNVESASEFKFATDMDVVIKSNAKGTLRKLVYTGNKPIGNDSGFIKVTRGSVTFEDILLSGSEVDRTNGLNNRVLYVAEAGEVIFSGRIVNGLVKTENMYDGGSAAYVADGGHLYLVDATVSDNYTTGGGAIYVADGGMCDIMDSELSGNESALGGAVYAAAQTGSNEYGLYIYGTTTISGNKAADGMGAGMYIEYGAKAMVEGQVSVAGNKVGREENNTYLADGESDGQVATLDINGGTTAADLGITCATEYAYRLVSLPTEGYDIAPTRAGDESGWSDDCGAWDIRYMSYKGVPGLYLCYKSVDAVFNGVDTLETLVAKDINGKDADYKNDVMPAVTMSADGRTLTAESIVLKDGGDYVVTITVDPTEYRLPTEDVVKAYVDGNPVKPGYDNQGDPEGNTLVLTIPADAIEGATDNVTIDLAAEKLYSLTVSMNGPLYSLDSGRIVDNRFSEEPIRLSESVKSDTTARYKLGGVPEGVTVNVTIYDADGNDCGSKAADAEGVVEFDGLDATMNYYIVLTYSKTYEVISRDVLELTLSTLAGQDLSDEYSNTTGDVDYDMSAGKAIISNVTADGSVEFSVRQAKETITFMPNEANARGEGKAASTVAELGFTSKEMPRGANTYGELSSASLQGYTFLGWFTDPVEGTLVEAGTAYRTGESVRTLYAHWRADTDTAYSIRHWVEHAEGGENRRYGDGVETKVVDGVRYYLYATTSEGDGESDESIDLRGHDLTAEEMTEAECSWWTREGFTPVFPEGCVVGANGKSVFDVVYDRNVYPVSFVNKGVEGSTAVVPEDQKDIPDGSVKFGGAYGELPVPQLPGYEFAGWYDDTKPGQEGLVTATTIHKATEGVELTAHWNPRRDTKWAIKVLTQDIARYEDGEYYKKGTWSESKTVYVDDEGNLLVGTTDTVVTMSIDAIKALDVKGFTYMGYSDKFDAVAAGMTASEDSFSVLVRATDASTDDGHGSYNKAFDGGIVYLYYSRDSVKAQFPNGQDEITEEEIVYGGDFTGKLPPKPGKDGYDFDHWVDPKDPSKEITEDTPADQYVLDGETIVVRPAWTARKYNLTYVPGLNARYVKAAGHGEAVKSQTVAGGYIDPTEVTYDEPMGDMPAAAKVGYVFDGWQLQGKEGFVTSETVVDVTNVVISNADVRPEPYLYEDTRPLYAKYTPHVYTLVFDAGSSSVTGEAGSVEPAEVQVTFDAKVGGIPTPTLRGYRFTGWVLNDDTEFDVRNGMVWTRPYANGTRIPVKATWVPENYRYTFDLNDRTGSTKARLLTTTVDYVEETFDCVYDRIFEVEAGRPGYWFKGWSLMADGDVLKLDDLVKLSENRTLYAIWEPKLYDVKLVMKGGSIADLTDNTDLDTYDPSATYEVDPDTEVITVWTIKVPFDSTYGELPIVTKEDCTYHGYLATAPNWPAKDGYGVTVHDQVITSLPQYIDHMDGDTNKDGSYKLPPIVLTAVLEPWFTFDPDGAKFVPDGGTDPVKRLQSDIKELPKVEKDGYSHEGWTGEDGKSKDLEYVQSVEEPETLKPIFIALVTMDANGGTVDGQVTKTVSMSTMDELPVPVREGYTFVGWFMDKEGTTKADYKALKEVNVPATVIARWKVNVSFDANGGTVDGKEKSEKAVDDLGDALPTPIRSGSYRFDGWFTEKSGGTKVELADVKAYNEFKTVYAHWTYTGSTGGSGGGGGGYTPPKKIEEPKTPLAGLDLLTKDHVAYIAGFPDGSVRPLADISRAEVAMIFYRLLTDEAKAMYKTSVHNFVDVDDWSWCATAIGTLQKAGIINGRGEGIFDPGAKITRAEFAAICARFDKLETDGEKFSDVPETHWAYKEIVSATAKGWVKGRGNGLFGPDDNLTRAEAMTLINRVLNRATEVDELEQKCDNANDIKVWPDNKNPYQWYYIAVMEATNGHDQDSKLDKAGKLDVETWNHVRDSKVGNQ